MAWTILVKSHQRNISAKLYGNRSSGFWQEDFLSFLYRYIGKISHAPWRPCLFFFDKSKWLEQSWKRITKGTFLQNYIEIGLVVSDKKIFLSFLYRYIGKISPAPWRPRFFTNPNGLNNLGRGSHKVHFCKSIWKSVQWFLTRRFFKFSI